MATYLAPISLGLGDLILSLPAVQALIESNQEVYLIAHSEPFKELASRIGCLAGTIDESALVDLPPSETLINLREHPLQKDYWWGEPKFDRDFPGWKINDVLDKICSDLGITANFNSLQPLTFHRQKQFADSVVFVPGSAGLSKCWPKEHWLSLAEKFNERDIPVLILGEPDCSPSVKELLPFLSWVPTPRLSDALDVISSARALVSIDTGLMHLAVHQGIPTIGLFRSHPFYFRSYPYSFAVTARLCDARCLSESFKFAYNSVTNFTDFNFKAWTCQVGANESCMANLSHEKVFAVAQSNQELFLGKKEIVSRS
jgi:ADP-heptose:LPS heptosyltransferase